MIFKSLRTKTSFATALLLTLVLFASGIFHLRVLESSLRNTIMEGANSTAELSAQTIDTYLEGTLSEVQALGSALPLAAIKAKDSAALDRFLKLQSDRFPKFENGLFILDAEGNLIADYPVHEEKRHQNFAFREYFQATMAQQKGVISPLYRSARSGQPVLTFTAYISAEDGTPLGLLACSSQMLSPRALGGFREKKIGQTGYIYVFDTTRLMILHPDPARIYQRDVPPGANQLFDAAVKGFTGIGETVNSRGIPMLAAVARIRATNWIVVAQQPTEEALSPIAALRWRLLATGTLVTLAAALFGGWIISRLTRPLEQLRKSLGLLSLPESEVFRLTSIEDSAFFQELQRKETSAEIMDLKGALSELYTRLHRSMSLTLNSTREWERTFDAVQDATLILDADHRILKLNRAAADLLRTSTQTGIGQHFYKLALGLDAPPTDCPHCMALSLGMPVHAEGENFHLGGYFEETCAPIPTPENSPLHLVYVLRNVTQKKRAEKQIERLAYYDSLTGLPNRTLLKERLEQSLVRARRQNSMVAVLFLDLDRFKSINDTMGHSAGDKLLQEVAIRIRSALRETDTVARQGGDEFVLVLSDLAGPNDVSRIAGSLLFALAPAMDIDGNSVYITTSIGIALSPLDGSDVETLMKNADIAMYQAKARGRNTFEFFSRQLDEENIRRLTLARELRQALKRDQFFLEYQPQVDLENGRILAVEALLRWEHPEMGLISPMNFIPLAEESGLIGSIGDWVLDSACAALKRFHTQGHAGLRMAVNISGRQLTEKTFPSHVLQILRDKGLSGPSLELELTETVLLDSSRENTVSFQTLRENGVRIAIDDFGTGYASFSYLQQLPFDKLKIAKPFIYDLVSNPNSSSIVDVIINIGHTLGAHLTAEGVETEDQLIQLQKMGCDDVQGFFLARPMREEELLLLLNNNHLPSLINNLA